MKNTKGQLYSQILLNSHCLWGYFHVRHWAAKKKLGHKGNTVCKTFVIFVTALRECPGPEVLNALNTSELLLRQIAKNECQKRLSDDPAKTTKSDLNICIVDSAQTYFAEFLLYAFRRTVPRASSAKTFPWLFKMWPWIFQWVIIC